MSKTEKGKTFQIGRLRGLIILNIKRRFLHLIAILEIIMHIIFLIRIFREIKVTHRQTLMALGIKNLLIITATMLRIMNVKNQ